MRHGHCWCCPEDAEPADVNRMAYVAVEQRRAETQAGVRFSLEVEVHLAQSEQIEMVNQKRREKQQSPSKRIDAIGQKAADLAIKLPNHAAHGLPFPEQQDHRETGKQHIRAALCCWRNDASPSAFEPWPRHNAVLQRK